MTLNTVKNLFAPLLAHEFNQQGAMQRAGVARAQGLDPAQFGTVYPGSTVTTTTNNRPGASWLPGTLIGAALLTAGAIGLPLLQPRPAQPPPAASTVQTPSAPSPVVPAKGPPAGLWIQETQQPDGTWKTDTTLQATENPDGTWSTPDGKRWQKNEDGSWSQAS